MTRKKRTLNKEEEKLWELVRKSADPLHPEAAPEPPPLPPAAPEPVAKPAVKAKPAAKPERMRPPPPPPPKVIPSIDKRTRSRLSRGVTDIDARFDLHGLTQTLAHQRLKHFLEEAQAAGAKMVLVITGKGAAGERDDFTTPERGVLRRAVPEWLSSPSFRHLVSGFDEAGRRHGGGGAIYIRIRRRAAG